MAPIGSEIHSQNNSPLPLALSIVVLETKPEVAPLFSESEVIDALYANQK